ncbi:MAG: alanine/ornithine racemase family PLP-dependent enzyme [Clostridiales Family XIII bacterium]|jgi:predicted amino acid racemase|nr:alanine/ornithine racemase family PLP-dependent enzyme [Clostridiales Family XIII bacterium]
MGYPRVEVDLEKLGNNVREIVRRSAELGIQVAGVIKGCGGLPECAKVMADEGCTAIASSRLSQLEAAKENGVNSPLMLIRIPMLSDVPEVIRLADISLNSELSVLEALDSEAGRQRKRHNIILMVELGDLREGIWDRRELVHTALKVENDFADLHLLGVGVNVGCYGSVAATVEKLSELVEAAEDVEAAIGRKLEIVSGGASTSLPRVMEKNMPARINHLRFGEAILFAKDLEDLWGINTPFLYKDVFTLKAEVVEVKVKPSYPIGEIAFDAFRNRPLYVDRGRRRRALIAVGKADYAFPEQLAPRDKGVEILGASSDHTILDIEEAERDIRVGDILEFDLCYAPAVFLTSPQDVEIRING